MPKYLIVLQDTYTRAHVIEVEEEENKNTEHLQARYNAGHIHAKDHFAGQVIKEHYGKLIFSRKLEDSFDESVATEMAQLLEEHGALPDGDIVQ